jgi:hypothetical protein
VPSSVEDGGGQCKCYGDKAYVDVPSKLGWASSLPQVSIWKMKGAHFLLSFYTPLAKSLS